MSRPLPFVSILVPAYNEEAYLRDCIESLLASDYPHDDMEILIIDGGSSDATRDIATGLADASSGIRVLDNPQRIVSTALNLGAQEARGELLLRADSHATYDRLYVRLSVEELLATGAASVGGRVVPRGRGVIGHTIADALSLPISTGRSAWRAGQDAGWVDTLWCGCWRKDDFEKVGGFDPEWVRNQDAEFNARLRRDVGRLRFDPRIRATLFVRESIGKLASQYFSYGLWRARTTLTHPSTLKLRQVLPALFLVLLLALIALAPIYPWPLLLLACLYLAVILVSILSLPRLDFHILLLPVVVPVIHLTWGAGFILGLFRELARKLGLQTPSSHHAS